MSIKRKSLLDNVNIEKAEKSKEELATIINKADRKKSKPKKTKPTDLSITESYDDKKTIKTFYISEAYNTELENHCRYLSYKQEKNISSSTIVNKLIGDYLKTIEKD